MRVLCPSPIPLWPGRQLGALREEYLPQLQLVVEVVTRRQAYQQQGTDGWRQSANMLKYMEQLVRLHHRRRPAATCQSACLPVCLPASQPVSLPPCLPR